MIRFLRLLRDSRGAAVIEMAIALPVLITMIWGIFQVGVAMQASAGMQHALGEGARLASIYPVRTDAAIKSKIAEKVFGVGIGSFGTPTITNGTGFKTLSVTFTMTPNFLFFNGPEISLTRTKKVYTAT
jgi:Flp pilus assembly protein TadG